MGSISPLRLATLENYTICPKQRELTFPNSRRKSIDSIESSITVQSYSSKFRLLWSKSG
ncbi:hypothetical protein CONCODRAFT_80912 [Conidiobolus coronatus NRRL 28638]|uniref:Uncharacterized protein n=1 Tax=Conidiobolus coronatus (strain ATCC 28846 / CBS 209.66 / NRRL 28638) TaxID=796925 RepID=A0A137NPX3_CONC2|nr:hypothetical protein CONCODRAFT_80912 [Conidiobolus coronatus NRRL 28638]|eukprot:KXN64805.1 hypothetical protein CONCODRAFT_80912 [Conidiobolus coronatus NRRL 28638]